MNENAFLRVTRCSFLYFNPETELPVYLGECPTYSEIVEKVEVRFQLTGLKKFESRNYKPKKIFPSDVTFS